MFDEDKILIISELGGLSLLVKIALKYGEIFWLSSESHLPFKILEANSYKGNAKIFGLYSQTGQIVNPPNLNEISLTKSICEAILTPELHFSAEPFKLNIKTELLSLANFQKKS